MRWPCNLTPRLKRGEIIKDVDILLDYIDGHGYYNCSGKLLTGGPNASMQPYVYQVSEGRHMSMSSEIHDVARGVVKEAKEKGYLIGARYWGGRSDSEFVLSNRGEERLHAWRTELEEAKRKAEAANEEDRAD